MGEVLHTKEIILTELQSKIYREIFEEAVSLFNNSRIMQQYLHCHFDESIIDSVHLKLHVDFFSNFYVNFINLRGWPVESINDVLPLMKETIKKSYDYVLSREKEQEKS